LVEDAADILIGASYIHEHAQGLISFEIPQKIDLESGWFNCRKNSDTIQQPHCMEIICEEGET
jgi:hypothetical protein